MKIAILLDGDFTRRLLVRRIGHIPSVLEIETFCLSILQQDEKLSATYFYDSPPFDEKRPLPISQKEIDFKQTRVYVRSSLFQQEMKENKFFHAHRIV